MYCLTVATYIVLKSDLQEPLGQKRQVYHCYCKSWYESKTVNNLNNWNTYNSYTRTA